MPTQRVAYADGTTTYTVIGSDYLPIAPAAEYLDHLRHIQASPNTIRSYAQGLAKWFDYLEIMGIPWDDFTGMQFAQWVTWLRTGDLPTTVRISSTPQVLAASTIKTRHAAVLSLYRYHAAANGLDGPYNTLYTTHAKSGRKKKPYTPFLAGIDRATSKAPSPTLRVRSGPQERTPVLDPKHIQAILDACSIQDDTGNWSGSLAAIRDRFYFALLAETGMRPGEALSLRHIDIQLGTGTHPAINVTPRQDHPRGARVKGGRARRIYVSDDLEALYAEYVYRLVDEGADLAYGEQFSQAFVFVNVGRGSGEPFAPLSTDAVYSRVRRLKNTMGDTVPPQWTPHWLRHTHATALLLSGCPPHAVMRRLGHLDVQTTLGVYGWVTEDAELRAVADWKKYTDQWKGPLS